RDDKRIMVSHMRYLEDIQREAEDVVKDERKKQGQEVQKAIKETQSKYEPTTLGDIAGLAELRDQLTSAAPKAEPKVEAPKAEPVVEPVAEPVAEAPAAEPAVETPEAAEEKTVAAKSGGDDLKVVEGIGPKIEDILHEAGISTFADLAGKTADEVREILLSHGSRYKMFDPETWPEQARLAADGK